MKGHTLSKVGAKARVIVVTLFRQLFNRSLHSFLLVVAPLYPVLKWIVFGAAGALFFGLFVDYVTSGFALPVWWGIVVNSALQYRIPIALALASFSVLFLFACIGHRRKETLRRLRDAFRLYKPAEELSLADLGFREASPQEPQRAETHEEERPFFGTYFPRKVLEVTEFVETDPALVREFTEEELEQLIRKNKGFLLIGLPYSGKTITIFHILRRMKDYVVVSPDDSQPVPNEDVFALLKGQKVIILLDNIATYAELNYDIETFSLRMKRATKGYCGVASACREGGELTRVVAGRGNHVTYFCEALLKLRLCPMIKNQLVALAQTAGMTLNLAEARLYPHPGNITMRDWTGAMKERFHVLTEPSKDTLRAMKLLDTGGIPITAPRLLITLTDVFHRNIEYEALEDIMRGLWDQFFLIEQPSKGKANPHFGHLAYVVSYKEGPDPEDEYWIDLAKALDMTRDVEALLQLSQAHCSRGDLVSALQILDGILRIDPEHADANFHRGYTLARLGKLREALEANTHALELRPAFAEAYNNRGYILSRLRLLPDALDSLDRALSLRPDYDDAHTNRAIVLARLSRFQEAMGEFNAALGIRPESYYAYLNLGITLSRQNIFDKALTAYGQALQLRPDYPEVYLNRGITLARMKKLSKALKEQDRAISLRPNYAEAHMHRGQTLASLTRYTEAVQALNRAIELRPDYALAYVNRARTYAHMGPEYQKAASKDWRAALDLGMLLPQDNLMLGISLARHGLFSEAMAIFDSIIDSYPDYAEAYCNRGIALGRMERYEEALKELDRAIELRPDYAEAYCNRGIALARMERYEEALKELDRAIELRPVYAEAYCNRGIALARMERYEEALKEIDRAMELRPDYAEAYCNRGIALSRMERYEEALKELDRAIELRPVYVEAHCRRGITLGRMERYEEALKELDRAIELRPDYAEAYCNRGIALARMERYEEALKELDRAIELRPDYAEAYCNRGIALTRMERYEEALKELDRAIELRPDYAEAYYQRGYTLTASNHYDLALLAFDRAIELRPDYAEAYYQRGYTLTASNHYDLALLAFDRAIELRPDYAEAHCDRGSALANLGYHDEALEAINVALKLRPEFAKAYVALGFVLTTIKGYDKARIKRALHAYDEAIRIQPTYPEAHRERGFILGQLGFDEEALIAFNRAIELRPDYAEALFGKARSLCFLARRKSPRFPGKKCLGEAMVLLERAAAIDASIISRLTKDRNAFRELRSAPDYGSRFHSLIWESP